MKPTRNGGAATDETRVREKAAFSDRGTIVSEEHMRDGGSGAFKNKGRTTMQGERKSDGLITENAACIFACQRLFLSATKNLL